ncbi:spindle and kinetochore-associated protein 1 homolog isoform X2 [Amborella trichopoda]|uniref:spindle and kinetochore-associated protein 1 homolog isoform X2 n=1 Tax=Amborella trichopoda TaxID=13333 RepID=UPI0009C0B017|nr:spindle and kinetochore-associated protein 1 homolog isoform X2 [Amborella trichopoda]|eukprot:XP_020520880.1 spindle and kinetochore-associated protein 1 homolog isoform X2 [Amborella trichopoda]
MDVNDGVKGAASSLNSLMAVFSNRVAELQELAIGRNVHIESCVSDLSAIDAVMKGLECQMKAIKDRLKEEAEAIPKAKKLIELSLHQQQKLQHMLTHLPSGLPPVATTTSGTTKCLQQEKLIGIPSIEPSKFEGDIALRKEKKGRGPVPRWYITAEELDSLSAYMRGRLTLDKLNYGVDEMAGYAAANAQLVAAPRKKELRDIAMSEAVKGKYFFLETDMKGPGLKLDNTGKAILTVLRHLGRIHETRIGHHRVIILSKPQP